MAKRPAKTPKPKPVHPREEWVLAAPDHYLVRWMSETAGGTRAWHESKPMELSVARMAAVQLPPTFLIYAVRHEPNVGENWIALVERARLTEAPSDDRQGQDDKGR